MSEYLLYDEVVRLLEAGDDICVSFKDGSGLSSKEIARCFLSTNKSNVSADTLNLLRVSGAIHCLADNGSYQRWGTAPSKRK